MPYKQRSRLGPCVLIRLIWRIWGRWSFSTSTFCTNQMRIAAILILALLCQGCGRPKTELASVRFDPQRNSLGVGMDSSYSLNNRPVGREVLSKLLVESSKKIDIKRGQKPPWVVISAADITWHQHVRTAVDICRFAGFWRLLLANAAGESVDLSTVELRPIPARHANATIIVLSADGLSNSPSELPNGETVILRCAKDSKHGETIRALQQLFNHGITNIVIHSVE